IVLEIEGVVDGAAGGVDDDLVAAARVGPAVVLHAVLHALHPVLVDGGAFVEDGSRGDEEVGPFAGIEAAHLVVYAEGGGGRFGEGGKGGALGEAVVESGAEVGPEGLDVAQVGGGEAEGHAGLFESGGVGGRHLPVLQ